MAVANSTDDKSPVLGPGLVYLSYVPPWRPGAGLAPEVVLRHFARLVPQLRQPHPVASGSARSHSICVHSYRRERELKLAKGGKNDRVKHDPGMKKPP